MIAETNYSNLSGSDISKIIDICSSLHQCESDNSAMKHFFNTLNPAIGHEHLSADMFKLNPFTLAAVENRTVDPYWINIFDQYKHEHPYAARMMSSNKPRHLETIQHEPTLKSFKNTALYNEFYQKIQGQNQLWMAFRDNNEILSFIYLREAEYTRNEMAMLQLIQPHIEIAWKNNRRMQELRQGLERLKKSIFQSAEEEAAAAQLREQIRNLTNRQRVVVEWVAAGMDNQQIADEMKISVLTVKKHLQAIFQSMEVQHRTELAAKWHQAHSITLH